MKFSETVRLGSSNILEHKKRSAGIILMIGILFGLVMGLSFVLNGLEKTLLQASTLKTGGKSYLTSEFYYALEGQNQAERLTARLAKYDGEAVGELTYYQFNSPVYVISESAVRDFVEVELSTVPADKIPVLIPETGLESSSDYEIAHSEQADSYADLDKDIQEKYYIVGKYPVTRHVQEDFTTSSDSSGMFDYSENTMALKPGANPFNLILGQIYSSNRYSILLVDDDSGKVEDYIDQKTASWRARKIEEELDYQDFLKTLPAEEGGEVIERDQILADLATIMPDSHTSTVAVFDSPLATAKYLDYHDLPDANDFGEVPFGASSLFSNTVEIAQVFLDFKTFVKSLVIVLLVIALVITILTFSHLVDGDITTVAMYRTMGATTGNVYAIYLLYLLELCILAVICCIIIALGLAGLTALLNGAALGTMLQEFYLLASPPKVSFLGISNILWIIIGLIILIAPLALGLTTHRFSAKYVAQKLKENS